MTDITIISGFLGAGKTTFANLLLDYFLRMGEKTAYVVNEFGQVGLDAALLEKKGFQTVDIFGGCICCTLRGKIKDALHEVIEEFAPSRIVFEPSGIFVFDGFAEVLEDPFLKEYCLIDSVLTVVDSCHLNKGMFVPGNFFANQIENADALVVSKLETCADDIDALSKKLHGLNRRADVVTKPWSSLTDRDFVSLVYGGGRRNFVSEAPAHGHAHVDSVTICPKEIDAEAVRLLGGLLKEDFFGTIYRVKGKVLYCGEPRLMQIAFDELRMDEETPDGADSLTFIGRDLQERRIREFFCKDLRTE